MTTFPIECCGEVHCAELFDDCEVYLPAHTYDWIESAKAMHEMGAELPGCMMFLDIVENLKNDFNRCHSAFLYNAFLGAGSVIHEFKRLVVLYFTELTISALKSLRTREVRLLWTEEGLSIEEYRDGLLVVLENIVRAHGNKVPLVHRKINVSNVEFRVKASARSTSLYDGTDVDLVWRNFMWFLVNHLDMMIGGIWGANSKNKHELEYITRKAFLMHRSLFQGFELFCPEKIEHVGDFERLFHQWKIGILEDVLNSESRRLECVS